MVTERQLRRAKRQLEKTRDHLLTRVKSSKSVFNAADERDTDEADIIVNIQTRAQELWAKDGLQHRLYEVEHALERMEEGEYGKCEACGTEIDPDRLLVIPETTLCVQCRAKTERFSRNLGQDDEDFFDLDLDEVSPRGDSDDDDDPRADFTINDDE